jgi:hypothetical protein
MRRSAAKDTQASYLVDLHGYEALFPRVRDALASIGVVDTADLAALDIARFHSLPGIGPLALQTFERFRRAHLPPRFRRAPVPDPRPPAAKTPAQATAVRSVHWDERGDRLGWKVDKQSVWLSRNLLSLMCRTRVPPVDEMAVTAFERHRAELDAFVRAQRWPAGDVVLGPEDIRACMRTDRPYRCGCFYERSKFRVLPR